MFFNCGIGIILFVEKTVADPQSLLEEKEAIEEKLALSEYELRLAQEDISKLKAELQKKSDFPPRLLELTGKIFFSCLILCDLHHYSVVIS